jgi:hypothetical protein
MRSGGITPADIVRRFGVQVLPIVSEPDYNYPGDKVQGSSEQARAGFRCMQ